MVRPFFACAMLLTLSLASNGGDAPAGKLPTPPTNANFEKMKKLSGTWLSADKAGKPTDQVVSVIKVIAGGSAIHETIFPGQPHEMISVYTVDGPELIMTHYGVLSNQPRMKSDPKSPAGHIWFQCWIGRIQTQPTAPMASRASRRLTYQRGPMNGAIQFPTLRN